MRHSSTVVTNPIDNLTTTFDDMILPTQRLGYFGIQKRDKGESPEWFGDEHICDFTKLAEVITQIVCRDVFRTTSYKYFTRYLRGSTLLYD